MLIILATFASHVFSRTLQESFVEKHEQWMADYGRTYQDEAEKQMRLNIFKQNLEYVEKANKEGNRTYKLSVNKFSDLTNEEFRALYTGYKMPSTHDHPQRRSGYSHRNRLPVPSNAGTCDAQKAATAAARISKFEDLPENDEQALLNAVSMHPVSVCIEGGGQDFQNYRMVFQRTMWGLSVITRPSLS
ncbi:Senescence-specific cysteine protease SAG39 [Melia azedarach]|nr:Senescence-specific cysteine protease SAG39 [Melia azedarach]